MTPDTAQNCPTLEEKSIAIVGVGLIGGSIAAGLKNRGFSGEIIGVGRQNKKLDLIQQAGLIDQGTTDIAEAAQQASLIVFCTPVNQIVAGVQTAMQNASSGTLVTDAGSVKQKICDEINAFSDSAGVQFVGSHPLAGSEKQGYQYADSDLFMNRVTILTPDDSTKPETLSRLMQLWKFLGSQVCSLSAMEHDQIVSRTSHLPHLVAAALVNSILNEQTASFVASGFKDTTRIAAGDTDLWNAILLSNREAVLESLDAFLQSVEKFRSSLSNSDASALKNLLQQAKTSRDRI